VRTRIAAWALVLTFLGLKAAAQESGKPATSEGGRPTSVVQKIMEMERKLRDANLNNDVSFLEQGIADDFVGINSRGNVYSKAENLRTRRSGYLEFESIEYSGQKIRAYGNTAVVTGTTHVKGSFAAHHFGGAYTYTRVYVKKGKSWEIVNFQVTKVLPPS
jgi:hypothetical protein